MYFFRTPLHRYDGLFLSLAKFVISSFQKLADRRVSLIILDPVLRPTQGVRSLCVETDRRLTLLLSFLRREPGSKLLLELLLPFLRVESRRNIYISRPMVDRDLLTVNGMHFLI